MLAEVENELNNQSKASEYLNLIRMRAALPNTTATTKIEMQLAIEHERRIEFIGEGHRWFDLKRTGKAVATMNAWFAAEGINIIIDNNDLLVPIPQNQIDTDPSLRQNAGY